MTRAHLFPLALIVLDVGAAVASGLERHQLARGN
jgi:hypothetical protein